MTELSTCMPTATEPCNFTCCSLGPFVSERRYYGQPEPPFGVDAILQVVLLLLVFAGGLLNVWSPAFTKPKSKLAPFFYQRVGTGLFLRMTPSEALGVSCVLGFYVARFVLFYRTFEPYESALEFYFPDSDGRARAIAQALEQVWYAALPIQISLGVKNNFWWWCAGLPVERAVAYHNANGYLMCAMLVGAWICYAVGGLTVRPLGAKFCFCDVNPIGGLIALISQCLLTLMSLPVVRRKQWEYFYLMGHFQLLFPMLWGMLFNDRVSIFPFYVLAFVMWGWSDLPLRIYMKAYQPTRVLSFATHGNNVAELRLTKKRADGSGKTIGLLTSQWEAGSYVWLAVRMPHANPLKGKAPPPFSLDWACYHPMTISSPPISRAGEPASDFTVHIKSMGPGTWSQALVDKIAQMQRDSAAPETLKVWIGGPNGKVSFSPMDCDRVVLIAGGIGVTPMIAIAQDLATRGRLGGEHAKGVPEVELVYTERHLESFAAFDDALGFLTSDESNGKAPSFTFKPYCTKPGTKGDDFAVHGVKGTTGRPNFERLLADAAQLKGSLEQAPSSLVVGIFSCGPPTMMADVRKAVQGASKANVKFYLHEETFEL